MKKDDMIGKRFGRLVVLECAGKNKQGAKTYICKCDCGNVTHPIAGYSLRRNDTRSCGCFAKETIKKTNSKHCKCYTRVYRIWSCMKQRCGYTKARNYKYYGAKGIEVCEEWANDFNAFYAWAIANGYEESLTIDRIDPNGNYEPSNCRWISLKEQQRNRTDNTHIEINGIKKTLSEWEETSGVLAATIANRYKRGIRGSELLKPTLVQPMPEYIEA